MFDDVSCHRRLGCAGYADRLFQRDVDVPALAFGGAPGAQGLAVDLDLGAHADLGADPRALPVDRDPPLPDQPIGLAPRAEAGVADVLVESHPDRGVAGGRAVWQTGPATARAEPAPPPLSGSLTKPPDISGLLFQPICEPIGRAACWERELK